MSQMQNSPYTYEASSSSPRPFGEIPKLWLNVFKMTEGFFAEEAPRASGSNTLVAIIFYAIISAIILGISSIISGEQITSLIKQYAGSELASESTLLLCYVCIGLLLTPIGFYVGNALTYLGARLLGGSGTYMTQTYLVSLFAVPLGVISSLLGMIPCVGAIASLFFGIYALILNVRAMKVTHQITTGKALIAVFWPVVLILLLSCCVAVLIVLSGVATGGVLSNIIEGLGIPTP